MSPQAQTAVILKVATISATLLALTTPAQARDLVGTSEATMSSTLSGTASKRPQRALLLSVGQASQSAGQLRQSLQSLSYTGVSVNDDERASSWSLGYRQPVSNRFSVDIQYQQQGNTEPSVQATLPSGKSNAQAAKDIAKAMPARGQGISAIGLYHHPVGHKLVLQAGVGALVWKSKRTATVGNATFINKSGGVSAALQLGVSYPITRNARIEGYWQHINMPDEAVNRVGVGIAYGF